METTTGLITVEELRQIPDPLGARYELHHGKLIEVTFPKQRHVAIQNRLVRLLSEAAQGRGVVQGEFPFRPRGEHDLWSADVALISRERWDATDPDDNLHGSPELVVEVLSRSNTAAEMLDKADLCLSTGSVEFWVLDPKRRTARVFPRRGDARVYHTAESITSELFPGAAIPVDSIFE